jgi:C4-dicarboxylate-specific signal transduction histidine kinase
MAAMLLRPLNDVFAMLQPILPTWMSPSVFAGMTVLVTTLLDRRARPDAATSTGAMGAAGTLRASAVSPAAKRLVSRGPCTDVGTELRHALSAARRQARSRARRVEVVAPDGLALGLAPARLRPVLLALLRDAIEHAPGGQVFVGAMRTEGEIRIVIIDDGRGAVEPLTAESRTSLARLLAFADATLLVDHRPGDGTTLMLCLPDAG